MEPQCCRFYMLPHFLITFLTLPPFLMAHLIRAFLHSELATGNCLKSRGRILEIKERRGACNTASPEIILAHSCIRGLHSGLATRPEDCNTEWPDIIRAHSLQRKNCLKSYGRILAFKACKICLKSNGRILAFKACNRKIA